jgi:hypothetical protein
LRALATRPSVHAAFVAACSVFVTEQDAPDPSLVVETPLQTSPDPEQDAGSGGTTVAASSAEAFASDRLRGRGVHCGECVGDAAALEEFPAAIAEALAAMTTHACTKNKTTTSRAPPATDTDTYKNETHKNASAPAAQRGAATAAVVNSPHKRACRPPPHLHFVCKLPQSRSSFGRWRRG